MQRTRKIRSKKMMQRTTKIIQLYIKSNNIITYNK